MGMWIWHHAKTIYTVWGSMDDCSAWYFFSCSQQHHPTYGHFPEGQFKQWREKLMSTDVYWSCIHLHLLTCITVKGLIKVSLLSALQYHNFLQWCSNICTTMDNLHHQKTFSFNQSTIFNRFYHLHSFLIPVHLFSSQGGIITKTWLGPHKYFFTSFQFVMNSHLIPYST